MRYSLFENIAKKKASPIELDEEKSLKRKEEEEKEKQEAKEAKEQI